MYIYAFVRGTFKEIKECKMTINKDGNIIINQFGVKKNYTCINLYQYFFNEVYLLQAIPSYKTIKAATMYVTFQNYIYYFNKIFKNSILILFGLCRYFSSIKSSFTYVRPFIHARDLNFTQVSLNKQNAIGISLECRAIISFAEAVFYSSFV